MYIVKSKIDDKSIYIYKSDDEGNYEFGIVIENEFENINLCVWIINLDKINYDAMPMKHEEKIGDLFSDFLLMCSSLGHIDEESVGY